jgi:lipopolysaccharide export system protein LptC
MSERNGHGREAVAQPLQPGAAAERWPQRVRSSAMEALRYSRFVTLMRHVLPLAVLAIVATVVAYAVIPRHPDRGMLSYRQTSNVAGDLSMQKPQLTGTDDKGNPYTITADSAVQEGRNAHRASLSGIEADMQYDGGRWASASARNGFFDLDAGTLRLGGGISLYTDTGYELHTKTAFAELKKNTITGNDRVEGHGPMGSLRADRFAVNRATQHLSLDGNVRMVMYPKKVKR